MHRINKALNNGRNSQQRIEKGMLWKKIPEGVLICMHSDTNGEVNKIAEQIAREMIAIGIAVILNPNPSFKEKTVIILVGAQAID